MRKRTKRKESGLGFIHSSGKNMISFNGNHTDISKFARSKVKILNFRAEKDGKLNL